jgi:hypothetical protein
MEQEQTQAEWFRRQLEADRRAIVVELAELGWPTEVVEAELDEPADKQNGGRTWHTRQ